MAIKEKFILLCDEVRQENNGKFMLIGVYTPDVAVPQLPVVLKQLTFFIALDDDRPDQHQIRFELQHLESGLKIAQGMGGFQAQRPGYLALPIGIGPLQIASAGAYTFSLYFDNSNSPITHSFNILLNIPTPQQQQAPGGGMR
jgi:hypothetical protein